jgi:hypothetical protein
VPVALSLGRDLAGASPARWLRTRLSELRPLPRLRADHRADVLITDRPTVAIELRDQVRGGTAR